MENKPSTHDHFQSFPGDDIPKANTGNRVRGGRVPRHNRDQNVLFLLSLFLSLSLSLLTKRVFSSSLTCQETGHPQERDGVDPELVAAMTVSSLSTKPF